MFYLPEAFMNVNSIDFGTTQQGGKLGMSVCAIIQSCQTHCILSVCVPPFTDLCRSIC